MANNESIVQKALMSALEKEFPTSYFIKVAQSIYSKAGIPDLVGSVNGKFVAIEVKTTKGKATKLQLRELRAISESDGLALICYGKEDIQYVIGAIEGHL